MARILALIGAGWGGMAGVGTAISSAVQRLSAPIFTIGSLLFGVLCLWIVYYLARAVVARRFGERL